MYALANVSTCPPAVSVVGLMVSALLLTLMPITPSIAETCLQHHAIYGDEDNRYRLKFLPDDGEQGMASNRFAFTSAAGDAILQGWVIWNNGESRPNGVLTYNCPGGDITDEELDQCKVWEGVVYTVDADGLVDLLPSGTDPAARSILLPDFGRRLRYSAAYHTEFVKSVPWDHFRFAGCESAN